MQPGWRSSAHTKPLGGSGPQPVRRARPTRPSAIGTTSYDHHAAGLLMRPAVEAVRLVMPWAAGSWAYRG